MYFWTNTPNQSQFIQVAALVNEFAGLAADPNVTEADAANYRAALAGAKDDLENRWYAVWADWQDWCREGKIYPIAFGKEGEFVFRVSGDGLGVYNVPVGSNVVTQNGTTFHWDDFYRTLALQSLLARATPPSADSAYNPRE